MINNLQVMESVVSYLDFEIKDLRENTTLEKKLKELYMNGGALYEMYGFFL